MCWCTEARRLNQADSLVRVFISRQNARRSQGKPVKLVISRVDGEDLVPGQFVQGCLTDYGVFAVLDSRVAIASVQTPQHN